MDRTLKSNPSPANAGQPIPNEAIRAELQKILASRTFRAAHGQKRFLAYAVEEVVAGNAQLLKEYVIATDALGRDVAFDPRLDPIVRTAARKLRAKLAKYYEVEGANDPLRIELPKGSYVPVFQEAPPAAPPSMAEIPVENTDIKIEAAALPPVPDVLIADPPPVRSSPDWRRAAGLAFAFLVFVTAATLYELAHSRLPQTTFRAKDASIAVLPLVNLGDNNDEFLSDGLTDELINALREAPGLKVVARTSAVRFEAKSFDLRAIDQKLHVRAVLVGTVSKSYNRLRVAVQLNNSGNGYHLWSGSYERDVVEMGTIPSEIATAVINVLGAGLNRNGAQNSFQTAVSPSPEAHEDYLKGIYFRNRYNVDSLNKAIGYFKRAITEDPSYAQAYAGLADCYAMARPVLATPPLELIPKIRAAASKAVELNPKLGEPHIDLAVSAEYEFDWATAEREFKKGLELSPGNVIGHIWYAWYLTLLGRKDEVLTEKTLAVQLDPVSPYAVESVGGYYSNFGRSETALEQYRSALVLEPNFGLAHQDLGDTYLFQGQCDNAIQELRLANEAMPGPRRMARLGFAYGVCGHPKEAHKILQGFLAEPRHGLIPALAVAEIYLGLGDKDRAVPWIERAIDERDLDLNLKWDAHFESLRSDPRFIELLHRMKLA
jgi:TolB-like protein